MIISRRSRVRRELGHAGTAGGRSAGSRELGSCYLGLCEESAHHVDLRSSGVRSSRETKVCVRSYQRLPTRIRASRSRGRPGRETGATDAA